MNRSICLPDWRAFLNVSLTLLASVAGSMAGPEAPGEVYRDAVAAFTIPKPQRLNAPYAELSRTPECALQDLFARVQQAVGKMTRTEQDHLSALSPDLALFVKREHEKLQSGMADSELPDFPTLDLVKDVPDTKITVHYSLTSSDEVPDESYPYDVAYRVWWALKAYEQSGFALPKPAGGSEKFHVYFRSVLSETGFSSARGYVLPVKGADGTNHVYFVFSTKLKAEFPGRFLPGLVSVCYHEAMHAVQCAYMNFEDAEWLFDSGAVWAQATYGSDPGRLLEHLAEADSVCKAPELPLWSYSRGGYHHYSVGAFMLALQPSKSGNVIKGLYERVRAQPPGQKDAMAALLNLFNNDKNAFGSFYRAYLRNLSVGSVTKELGSVGKPPPVKMFATVTTVGWTDSFLLQPTGARFYSIAIDPNDVIVKEITNRSLLISLQSAGNVVGEGVAITRPNGVLSESLIRPLGTTAIAPWKGESFTFFVTDTSSLNETTQTTSETIDIESPFLKLVSGTNPPQVRLGQSATVQLTYDLLGVSPSASFLTVDYAFLNPSPLLNIPLPGQYNLAPGSGGTFPITLTTAGNETGIANVLFHMTAPSFVAYPNLPDRTTLRWQITIPVVK